MNSPLHNNPTHQLSARDFTDPKVLTSLSSSIFNDGSSENAVFSSQVAPYAQYSDILNIKSSAPLMLTDIRTIVSQCNEFATHLPGVELFYAIKALPEDEVITSLIPHVSGYDAASIGEIDQLLSCGVIASTILFSNPVKPTKAIAEAFKKGVHYFAFQSYEELEKLSKHAPGSKVYARVKMDDSHSAVPLSSKFGCKPEEVYDLLVCAKSLGLQPVGLTFHVGSQSTGLDSWVSALTRSFALYEQVESRGISLELIDIGGGFPAAYFTSDTHFTDVAAAIADILKQHPGVRIIAEPGRMIVASSSSIVATVIGIEVRDNRRWIYTDVGLFQAFTGAMRYETFPYSPYALKNIGNDGLPVQTQVSQAVITGPTCDSQDIITEDAWLPDDLEVDDILVFPNAGAYTTAYGSNFNGFEVPKRCFIK